MSDDVVRRRKCGTGMVPSREVDGDEEVVLGDVYCHVRKGLMVG
jgi:hypothetical protein